MGTTTPARMILLPLAREMLVEAYMHLFQEGTPLDRQAWAEAGGHGRGEVANAVNDLRGRNLARPVGGGGLTLTTGGVERVEGYGLADADLIEAQFALRREILRALEERRADAETTGGLSVDEIAAAVGESAQRVLPSLLVLRDRFLLQAEVPAEVQVDVGDPPGLPLTFRISEPGRRALQSVQQMWPLSVVTVGYGGRPNRAAAPAEAAEPKGRE